MDRCRYSIALLVPDPTRNEHINVGILFQTDQRIAARFIPSLPRSVLPGEHLREYVRSLQAVWDERLSVGEEWIVLDGWNGPRMTSRTSEDFLWWLHYSYGAFLRFSEPRGVETESLDSFQIGVLMDEMYDTLVSRRKSRLEPRVTAVLVPKKRSEVKQRIERAFRLSGVQRYLTAAAQVDGKLAKRWRFDWAHLNQTTGFLIDTIWLGYQKPDANLRHAAYLSAKARDVGRAGHYEMHGVVYSPNGKRDESVEQSRALLIDSGIILEELVTVDELALRLADQVSGT